MKELSRVVFYCDFCRKHGLSRAAMERHEAVCTLNPRRVCRWRINGHSDGSRVLDIAAIAESLAGRAHVVERAAVADSPPGIEQLRGLTSADVDWLRGEVDGCPACMLAALRQSGVDEYHYSDGVMIFDYQREVERLRQEEREEAGRDVW